MREYGNWPDGLRLTTLTRLEVNLQNAGDKKKPPNNYALNDLFIISIMKSLITGVLL